MKPLAFVSPYLWLFWAVLLLAYLPEFRSNGCPLASGAGREDGSRLDDFHHAGRMDRDAGSFMVVLESQAFAITRGEKVWFVAGLVTVLAGSLLRRPLLAHAGGNISPATLKLSADQPLVEQGLYRWVRHPSYTGGMLMYVGTGLALTNWLERADYRVGRRGVAYLYRVRVEEHALQANLGGRYQQYMRRTKRFVPFIF